MDFSIGGARNFAKSVEFSLLGRRLALLGSMGRGAFAHMIQLLERPEEVRAARRAHFLLHQEGAIGSHEGSAVVSKESPVDAHGVIDKSAWDTQHFVRSLDACVQWVYSTT